jgi:hypothetical protein
VELDHSCGLVPPLVLNQSLVVVFQLPAPSLPPVLLNEGSKT